MAITVSYRGVLADMGRVEDFEDRVVDLALELGSHVNIWRSADENDPRRVVRGVCVDLFPGQETTSLLVSPEGWLINQSQIEEAEKGTLREPPWCSVKTQFGPLEGHVALVELFAALKQEFLPGLEVRDNSEYWETRDLATLKRKTSAVQASIEGFPGNHRQYGLSSEAAEDAGIVAARVERIARLVRTILARPAEHPPVRWGEGPDDGEGFSAEGSEAQWDASYKENRRKQERLHRAIEERLASGQDHDEAFDGALRDEGILDVPDESPAEMPDDWFDRDDDEDAEPWKESLPEAFDEDREESSGRERHPVLQRVMDLLVRLDKLFDAQGEARSSHAATLCRGAGEMLGGLAQAMGNRDWEPMCGLAMVQLKRALRGAAFAQGAIPPLRADGTFDAAVSAELRAAIQEIQADILAELARLREPLDE